MSYAGTPAQNYPQSPHPPQAYSSTPPPPPPKPSTTNTPKTNQGPPLPPPPSEQNQEGPSELDGGQPYPQSYQQQAHPQQPNVPPIEPGWLPESLKDKTTTDLHALLNDPELQNALLSNSDTTHASIPAAEAALRPLVNQNLDLANNLLQLEEQLSHQRQETQSRLLTLRALEQSHRTKIAETEQALQQFSPMALYQKLSASVQEQDSLVRGMEESWLEEGGLAGEREVGEFVRRVREARRVGFLRGERKGRWDEGRVGGWR